MKIRGKSIRITASVVSLTLALTSVFAGSVFATGPSGDDASSPGGAAPAPVYEFVTPNPSEPSSHGYINPGIDTSKIDSADYSGDGGKIAAAEALPVSFDLRASAFPSRSTPVRDQGGYGACWTFAALASAESSESLNALNGTANPQILSPYHLVYAAFNPQTFSSGTDEPLSMGGNSFMATAAMSKGFGPQLESAYLYPLEDSYEDPTVYPASLNPIPLSGLNTSVFTLRDTFLLPSPRVWVYDDEGEPTGLSDVNRSSLDVIKTVLYSRGALYVTYNAGPEGIPSDEVYPEALDGTYSYFTGDYFEEEDYAQDHAVTIVGWDDDYPKTNFNVGGVPAYNTVQPQDDGAFLIKNSWGADFADDGYFWMSYEEKTIGEIAFLNLSSKSDSENIYYYDELGYQGTYISATQYMANIFTVGTQTSHQGLHSAAFYTTEPNVEYQVSVYKNPGATNPASGSKAIIGAGSATVISGTATYAGYHTVYFQSTVPLHTGDRYSVVVSQLTSDNTAIPLPIESKLSNKDTVTIAAGESFLSDDGVAWDDLESIYSEWGDGAEYGNTCIKALTSKLTIETASVSATPATNQKAGAPIDVSAGTLLLTYDDGTQETVPMTSPWVSITGYDSATPGEQTLSVSFDGVYAGTFSVYVVPAASFVTATLISGAAIPAKYSYNANAVDHTISLTAKVAPAEAVQDVTWAATGPASVSPDGVVSFTGAEGAVTVTVTTADDTKVTSACSIAVTKHVTKITSPVSTLYMKKNSTLTPVVVALDGTIKVPAALTYKSGNTKVLTVNASGKFTAKKVKKKTKVIVTVNAANGTSKKLTVYVVPGASKVKRITVIGSPKTLKIGAIKQLTIKLNPASATNVKPTFRSSKSSVVSVDASGNMRALKKGTAVITVKVSGKTAKTKRITVR